MEERFVRRGKKGKWNFWQSSHSFQKESSRGKEGTINIFLIERDLSIWLKKPVY